MRVDLKELKEKYRLMWEKTFPQKLALASMGIDGIQAGIDELAKLGERFEVRAWEPPPPEPSVQAKPASPAGTTTAAAGAAAAGAGAPKVTVATPKPAAAPATPPPVTKPAA